jgi:hypothetical protein
MNEIRACVEIDRISVNYRNMYHSIMGVGHLTAVPFLVAFQRADRIAGMNLWV